MRISRRIRVVGFAVLAVVLAMAGTVARADDRAGATEIVEHFQNGLLYTLLHRREMDYDTRIQAIEALIAETFDVERVARKVIGGEWYNEMSVSEQRRYQTLFTRYVVATQSRSLGSLEGREFVPLGRRYGPNGTVVVDVSFREQGREITTVAYILLPTGKGWR